MLSFRNAFHSIRKEVIYDFHLSGFFFAYIGQRKAREEKSITDGQKQPPATYNQQSNSEKSFCKEWYQLYVSIFFPLSRPLFHLSRKWIFFIPSGKCDVDFVNLFSPPHRRTTYIPLTHMLLCCVCSFTTTYFQFRTRSSLEKLSFSSGNAWLSDWLTEWLT